MGCLCMEMSGPHWHQTALVDLHIKKVAMAGAFRLLEQVTEGVEDPSDDAYIRVDVTDAADGLFSKLCRMETLFRRCGGAAKAFSSASMRRNLAPLVGCGGLEKHDFDTVSRRIRERGSSLTMRDRHIPNQAM